MKESCENGKMHSHVKVYTGHAVPGAEHEEPSAHQVVILCPNHIIRVDVLVQLWQRVLPPHQVHVRVKHGLADSLPLFYCCQQDVRSLSCQAIEAFGIVFEALNSRS